MRTGVLEKSITVHPRLRGELVRCVKSQQKLVGSSPLTRGTHLKGIRDALETRFIPAYAGNSE